MMYNIDLILKNDEYYDFELFEEFSYEFKLFNVPFYEFELIEENLYEFVLFDDNSIDLKIKALPKTVKEIPYNPVSLCLNKKDFILPNKNLLIKDYLKCFLTP